jgi:DNA-binding transcriptional ArsR family regulator
MTSNLPRAAQRAAADLDRAEVLATFFHGLSDPTRVRILELLAERPRTVTELVADLGIASRYMLVDERIRQILRLGEAIVRDNAERLTSCLVLATEGAGAAPLE